MEGQEVDSEYSWLSDEALLLGFAPGMWLVSSREPAEGMGSVVGSRAYSDERVGSLVADSTTGLWLSIPANSRQIWNRRRYVFATASDGCGKRAPER